MAVLALAGPASPPQLPSPNRGSSPSSEPTEEASASEQAEEDLCFKSV